MIANVWRPVPAREQPVVKITRWAIKKLPDGDLHFVGRVNGSGRVSSKIMHLDANTKSGITKSGRVYMLIGGPNMDMDALYVWQIWCRLNDIEPGDCTDVTDTIFEEKTDEPQADVR